MLILYRNDVKIIQNESTSSSHWQRYFLYFKTTWNLYPRHHNQPTWIVHFAITTWKMGHDILKFGSHGVPCVYMCEVHVERSKYEHCGMYTVFFMLVSWAALQMPLQSLAHPMSQVFWWQHVLEMLCRSAHGGCGPALSVGTSRHRPALVDVSTYVSVWINKNFSLSSSIALCSLHYVTSFHKCW